MSMIQVNLSEPNRQKLEALRRRTGRSADELLNDAVAHYEASAPARDESPRWKQALLGIEGMWKDRDDLDMLLSQLRREADRVEPPDQIP